MTSAHHISNIQHYGRSSRPSAPLSGHEPSRLRAACCRRGHQDSIGEAMGQRERLRAPALTHPALLLSRLAKRKEKYNQLSTIFRNLLHSY